MNPIKVSIVVPVYNAERYLRECIESALRQTLQDIELILINDGSKDSSGSICKEYAAKDARIVYISQMNQGSAAARKAGMKRACGEYIGFIDSDDWAEPNMYEVMYNTAKQNDADIVFCNCYKNDDNGKEIKCDKHIRNGLYDRKQIVEDILSRSLAGLDNKGRSSVIRWCNWLRIYKRSMIVEHDIYNDERFRRCQDLQLTFEATLYAQRYYYLGDQYLYHNRVVNSSLSRGYTKNMWPLVKVLIERLYEDVNQFQEVDLHKQMDLCAFFFAVEAVNNEGKQMRARSNKERMGNLKRIANDDLVELFLPGVSYEKLAWFNKAIYRGLKNHSAFRLNLAINEVKLYKKMNLLITRLLIIPAIKYLHDKLKKGK